MKYIAYKETLRAASVKFFLAALLAVIAVSLTACGFDDEEEPGATYPIELLGLWEGVTRDVVAEASDGTVTSVGTSDIADERVSVNTNGTFVVYRRAAGNDWKESSRSFWAYADGKLVLSGRSGDVVCTVRSLSETSLVLEHKEKAGLPDDDTDSDSGTPDAQPSEAPVLLITETYTRVTY